VNTDEVIIGPDYTSIIAGNDDVQGFHRDLKIGEKTEVPFNPLCRRRTIRTSDFYANLKNKISPTTEVLPDGCKFFDISTTGSKMFVIEQPPNIRTIRVDIGIEQLIEKLRLTGKLKEYGYENYKKDFKRHKDGYYNFQLAFPFVVLIIVLNSRNEMCEIQPFFRTTPVTSVLDHLYIAPLYNVPTEQTMCMGSGIRSYNSISETIDNIVEHFWINVYNQDYTNNLTKYGKTEEYRVHDYLTWAYFTKQDPMFVFDVDWIPYHLKIVDILNNINTKRGRTNSSHDSYNSIFGSAFEATSTRNNTKAIVHNTTYSMAIKQGVTITVGDEISYKDEKMYLYSILADKNGSYAGVELENEKGEIEHIEFKTFEKNYKNAIKIVKLDKVIINGKTLSEGDIISFDVLGNTVYKTVQSIRQAKDGRLEALMNNDHYLIDNLKFDIFDSSAIKINGLPIDKKGTYHMLAIQDSSCPLYQVYDCKFHSLSVGSGSSISIKFEATNGNMYYLNHKNHLAGTSEYEFINNDLIEIPPVLMWFDKLMTNRKVTEYNEHFKIIKGRGISVGIGMRVRSYFNGGQEILKTILIEDNTRLHIPTIGTDIDFRVGDPIVYAGWKNPEDMLLISSITRFEYDENRNMFYVYSMTLNKKKEFKIPFINFGNNRVNVGIIRKVTSKFGTWSSGDKIIAETPGVTNFPKKDVNTIIAFIDDGNVKYPLALCSNLCTLWMNDDTMSKFKVLKFKSAPWKKVESNLFNIEKIKYQHGDMFRSTQYNFSSIYVATKRNGSSYGMDLSYCSNYGTIDNGGEANKSYLDRSFIRYGILTPRYATTSSQASKISQGFPNMLGGYYFNKYAGTYFRSDQFKEDF